MTEVTARGGRWNLRAAPTSTVMVSTRTASGAERHPDEVAGEEPMEVRVASAGRSEPGDATPVAVTMRTPGNDFELAVGFLLSEGVLRDQGQLRGVRYCELEAGEEQNYNVVTVTTAEPLGPSASRRSTAVSASCGLCGTATLEDLSRRCPAIGQGCQVRASVLVGLVDALRQHQRVFSRTGGLHGAGLFDAQGTALCVREDIGRHNAVDKLVGWAAMHQLLPLEQAILVVSGRVSFEIVQKAAIAGITVLAAASAPSSLAVASAQELGMTLAGFVRDGRANIYSATWRVEGDPS